MPCFHPLTAYYARAINESGKRSLVFNVDKALLPEPIKIACGRCVGCRLDRSLSWALRCVHEASLYDENTFITLTFNDNNTSHTLNTSDFQNFMKRLRKKIEPKKVRFFHCGEYGENFGRPHHHACLFGFDFPDKKLFNSYGKSKIYTSEMLAQLWPYGFHTIGDVTFDSCAYVARYILKKWSKEELRENNLYEQMVSFTKAVRLGLTKPIPGHKPSDEDILKHYNGRKPEYVTMSRNPGIGDKWFDQFNTDIYPGGFCIIDGKKVKPPKFYDSKYEIINPMEYAKIKGIRIDRANSDPDNTPRRLETKEKLKNIKIKTFLKRTYENDNESVLNFR